MADKTFIEIMVYIVGGMGSIGGVILLRNLINKSITTIIDEYSESAKKDAEYKTNLITYRIDVIEKSLNEIKEKIDTLHTLLYEKAKELVVTKNEISNIQDEIKEIKENCKYMHWRGD